MPALGYSHHKNPETGETILIPSLFPISKSSGEFSSTELETWVKTGLIPEELYRSDLQAKQKMEEIQNRVANGEQVNTSEFPPNLFALTDYLVTNKARLHGENVLKKIYSSLDNSDPDIVWLSFVKEATLSLTSIDPQPIHFYTARKVLKEKYEIEDARAVDILSRELLEHCKTISNFKAFHHKAFSKNPIDLEDLNDHLKHEKHEILQADFEFISYLKGVGPKGKKLATDVKKNSEEVFKFYKSEGYPNSYRKDVWGLWVTKEEPINASLFLLGQSLWEDRCKHIWSRQSKQVPAITSPIIEIIKPILNPNKKSFVHENETIICYDKGGVPILSAPVIDANMFSVFKNGIKHLSTLTGHKIVRWQIQTGFDNWASNSPDPRLIEIEGGYSKISELCRCNSEHDIAKIRDILHAQAHGYFTFPDGTRGNMIALRVMEKYRNSEPSKINIILGDMLLPNYVFRLPNNARRLIPIGDFPPFHGSKNTYANQAHLQLLVFEEFANQSDRLAKEGFVLISNERWEQMARESGINHHKIKEIIHHWSQPDLVNWFLDKQDEEYRLTSYYKKVENFLLYQGEQRLINSEKGKKSAANRKKISLEV
jgi:hypothetical protein